MGKPIQKSLEQGKSNTGKHDLGKVGEKSPKNLLLVFQLACLATIVLNANLAGEILFSIINNGYHMVHVVVLASVVLNVMEIINNWASIKIFLKEYTSGLFVLDVVTLGIFYLQIYVLTKMVEKFRMEETHGFMFVILWSYIILFVLYISWNIPVLLSIYKRRKVAKRSTLGRDDWTKVKDIWQFSIFRVVLIIGALLILYSPWGEGAKLIAYFVFISLCILFWWKHSRNIKVIDAVIYDTELGKDLG